MSIINTTEPYDTIEYEGIQYCTCRDYDHISRHSCLRQVVHSPQSIQNRFTSLETPNAFQSNISDCFYYDVKSHEENRLDILADRYLGSASYAWIIAYYNDISDGYTIREGQRLKIPRNISSLFQKGELLEPVNALQLNLGSE